MLKKPLIESVFECIYNIKNCVNKMINMTSEDKEIHDAILKTFNTGSGEFLESVYVRTKLSTEQFYNVFRRLIISFDVRNCPLLFIKSILDFWDNHGLKSKELETLYQKWADIEWFALIKEVEYKPFWKWMFSSGMKVFNVAYIVEYLNVTFDELITKIASEDEYSEMLFNKYLDKFLDSIWEAVLTTIEVPIGHAIDALVHEFPSYEVKILNHAYYYFADYSNPDLQRDVNEALLYVIERMADYEYGMNGNFFSEGTPKIPYNSNVGNVNVTTAVELLIKKFSQDRLLKDIVWVLENRFNIDSDYIEECLCDEFLNICTSYDLKTLVKRNAICKYSILDVLFQFPLGSNLFSIFFDDIFKRIYEFELEVLEDEYGLSIDNCDIK